MEQTKTLEDEARALVSRLGYETDMLSASDLCELANLLSEVSRLRKEVEQANKKCASAVAANTAEFEAHKLTISDFRQQLHEASIALEDYRLRLASAEQQLAESQAEVSHYIGLSEK